MSSRDPPSNSETWPRNTFEHSGSEPLPWPYPAILVETGTVDRRFIKNDFTDSGLPKILTSFMKPPPTNKVMEHGPYYIFRFRSDSGGVPGG